MENSHRGVYAMVTTYCMKERKKNVEMKDLVYRKTERGGIMIHGKCGSCGGNVTRVTKASDVPKGVHVQAYSAKKGAGDAKSKKSKRSARSKKSKRSAKSRK